MELWLVGTCGIMVGLVDFKLWLVSTHGTRVGWYTLNPGLVGIVELGLVGAHESMVG